MARSGILGMALLTAAAVSACTGYLATQGGYTTTPAVSQWQDPQFFGARVRQRMSEIEQHIRADIAQAQLPAESINEFHARRQHVEQVLAQASFDGVIDPLERQQVRDLVRSAAQLGEVHTGPSPYGYGGGPGYAQPGAVPPGAAPPGGYGYFDPNWEWGL